MPTKKTALVDETAAPSAPTVVIEEAHRRTIPGLAIAGITLGGVLLAGALFGGGVVLGEHLTPAHGGFGTHQQGFPGGPNGFGGPGPVMPGQGNRGGQQGGPQGNGS